LPQEKNPGSGSGFKPLQIQAGQVKHFERPSVLD
jgi:hypothetical protein